MYFGAIRIIQLEKVHGSRWVSQNAFLGKKERTEWATLFGWNRGSDQDSLTHMWVKTPQETIILYLCLLKNKQMPKNFTTPAIKELTFHRNAIAKF